MTLVYDIYPGQYHPRTGSLHKTLHYGNALISQFPYSGITRIDHTYQIKIPVPGIARENVFIEVSGNHMIVKILDQQRTRDDKPLRKRARIVRKCFIRLPPDADTNFASAIIHDDFLTIELAKKDTDIKNVPGYIIPY